MGLELEGKRALVTGSSSGIGEAIARDFARAGAKVFVHGRNPGRTEKVAQEIGGAWATADVENADGANALIEAVNKAFGGIDILVNNTGGANTASENSSAYDSSPEDWMAMYNANWITALRMIQAFVPGMKERGWGRVIQIASRSGFSPQPATADYGSSKASMINATTSLARGLAFTGVTSNVITPGLIITAKAEEWLWGLSKKHGWGDTWNDIEKAMAKSPQANMVGRLGRPVDISRAALFLASPAADFITGMEMRIDGGRPTG